METREVSSKNLLNAFSKCGRKRRNRRTSDRPVTVPATEPTSFVRQEEVLKRFRFELLVWF